MVGDPLTTGAALLLVLRDGPGYGIDLVRRVNAATRGRVRPSLGNVHRTLERLRRSGHVRRWDVVPGGRRGARGRVYYELTLRGIAEADATVLTLRALVAPGARKQSSAKARAMRKRLRSAADASALVARLQDQLVKGLRGSR